MSYKAQLVVRARNKEGVELIEKVKELANDEGVTYSEKAVELLGVALGGGSTAAAGDDATQEAKSTSKTADAAPPAAASRKPRSSQPNHERAPLPAEEAGPSVDPELPPEEIVKHYLERRQERGERAAGRILVDFFAHAGPGEGGQLKKLLQAEYDADEYEQLMEPIKATDEYSTYTERAIFGEPSPYSEVR